MSSIMSNIQLPKFGTFGALMRREFLDHKTGFFTVPMVISGFLIVIMFASLFFKNVGIGFGPDGSETRGISFVLGEFAEASAEEKRLIWAAMLGANSALIYLVLGFVLFFTPLSTLFDDRKDRSILFWKSMPVSNVQEVASKLLGFAVMAPVIASLFAFAIHITLLVMATVLVWSHGLSAWELVWAPAPVFSMWFILLTHYFVFALWLLPIFGWLMLASAYAPKAPLLFAAVPIAGLILMEHLVLRTHEIAQWLFGRVREPAELIANIVAGRGAHYIEDVEVYLPNLTDAFVAAGQSLATPGFWVGLVIAGGLFTAVVWLRKTHA